MSSAKKTAPACRTYRAPPASLKSLCTGRVLPSHSALSVAASHAAVMLAETACTLTFRHEQVLPLVVADMRPLYGGKGVGVVVEPALLAQPRASLFRGQISLLLRIRDDPVLILGGEVGCLPDRRICWCLFVRWSDCRLQRYWATVAFVRVLAVIRYQ